MSTFSGILLDVSRSMEDNIGDGVDEEGGKWVRSLFRVIDDLVKHDVSGDSQVFAVGVGASRGEPVFDIIGTIKEIQKLNGTGIDRRDAPNNIIAEVFNLLERSGAKTIRKWARISDVCSVVSEHSANLILEKLRTDREFTKKFVFDFLPASCRDWNDNVPFDEILPDIPIGRSLKSMYSSAVSISQDMYSSAVSTFRQANESEIKDVERKSMDFIKQSFKKSFNVVRFSEESVYSVERAASIIRGSVKEKDLTKQRARELLADVEPYIYGRTPLYSALTKASSMLSARALYPGCRRMLFVLSDGMATDVGNLRDLQSKLKVADVAVVGCYISRSSNVEPRRLHNTSESKWEKGAKFLFNLSSMIPTELVTRAIFLKHGWQLDITNNETRLFMHVNHPDHLKDACNLARNVVCSQDALSYLLVSVSLDIYINQKNTSIKAHEQVEETCYANASAVVLHLAMHRILGRMGGYPDFEKLRDDMINKHGSEGANTLRVLKDVCPMYRLHCKEVNADEALKAVTAKRPVVAMFQLTDDEWDKFGNFYVNNPTGILKKKDLDISSRNIRARTDGHAVVLTSYNSECLRLMNSWGEIWADKGFFRVENADVLGMAFIDIFWTLNDLYWTEKFYYSIYGSEVAAKLMRSFKSLQLADFTCPLCFAKSKVTEFSGTLSRASCPRCHREFSSHDGEGNILALNMYLTSLTR